MIAEYLFINLVLYFIVLPFTIAILLFILFIILMGWFLNE